MIQSSHMHVQKCSCSQIFLVFLITQIKGSGKPKRQPSQLNRCLNKKSLFYFYVPSKSCTLSQFQLLRKKTSFRELLCETACTKSKTHNKNKKLSFKDVLSSHWRLCTVPGDADD